MMAGPLGHALYILQKHRELIRCEDGFYRSSAEAYSSVTPKQIEALVAAGHCRIDALGSAKAVP
jgi:hypothetical protein